jgi:hypothetical protein
MKVGTTTASATSHGLKTRGRAGETAADIARGPALMASSLSELQAEQKGNSMISYENRWPSRQAA